MSRKPRVIYWNNIPAPYMVERFNALALRGNLDFEAWFSARSEYGRSWLVDESRWRFPYRYLPRCGLKSTAFVLPTRLAFESDSALLVSFYGGASYVIGWAIARWRGLKTAFWVEVTSDAWVRRHPFKESLKRALFPKLDGVITAGPDGRRFALSYGAKSDRIYIARHAVQAKWFSDARAQLLPQRAAIRAALGVRGVVFLYVGRLVRGKGLDHLLDAFALLQEKCVTPTSLLLVGDGTDETRYRTRSRELSLENVSFAGFVQQPTLPRMYVAADVFVFPTLGDPYGLVLDEAMASSLPVVTTAAAGEVTTRVVDGENGWIVPPADGTAMASKMAILAEDSALRSRLGAASLRMMADSSPERWATEFEHAAHQILAADRPLRAPGRRRGITGTSR